MRPILLSLLLIATSFSGCLDDPQQVDDTIDSPPLPFMINESFPDFTAPDETNTMWNKSMMGDAPWVAYFSAEWCTHCEPTLNATDQAIPINRLLIFNKQDGENNGDMLEWKNTSESGLNRSIDRPFIHAPELATSIGVGGIPFMLYINAEGTIISHHIGLWINGTEMIAWFESGGIDFADSISEPNMSDGMEMK